MSEWSEVDPATVHCDHCMSDGEDDPEITCGACAELSEVLVERATLEAQLAAAEATLAQMRGLVPADLAQRLTGLELEAHCSASHGHMTEAEPADILLLVGVARAAGGGE